MQYGYYADREPMAYDEYPFRCPSWNPMPDGKKNVVILGCSHTWGVGLEPHETWAHHVSQHNTNRLRYWNLGQPGYSPEAVVRMLYRTEKTLCPNIIIICWPETSRREWLDPSGGPSKKLHPRDLMGTDEKLKHHNKDTDKQTFLKSLFFVEKFAEKTNAKTFHAFASDVIELDKAHYPTLNVLQDYTLRNCWPHWDKFTQRELHTEPDLARDGIHYGVEHHKRFAKLFLDCFGPKLR
mgnify:CR=1 FL=1